MISISLQDFDRIPKGIAEMAQDVAEPAPIMRDFGSHMVRTWTLKFPRTSGHKAGSPGEPPAVQSSRLRASLTYEVSSDGERLEAGSPEEYAGIQHEGGTIKPRTAKALTVPISPKAYGKRARDFAGLFRIPPKEGEEAADLGVLAVETASGGVEPLFALRGSVTLPARPWLLIYDSDWQYLERRIQRHLDQEAS